MTLTVLAVNLDHGITHITCVVHVLTFYEMIPECLVWAQSNSNVVSAEHSLDAVWRYFDVRYDDNAL